MPDVLIYLTSDNLHAACTLLVHFAFETERINVSKNCRPSLNWQPPEFVVNQQNPLTGMCG